MDRDGGRNSGMERGTREGQNNVEGDRGVGAGRGNKGGGGMREERMSLLVAIETNIFYLCVSQEPQD